MAIAARWRPRRALTFWLSTKFDPLLNQHQLSLRVPGDWWETRSLTAAVLANPVPNDLGFPRASHHGEADGPM